MKTIKNNRLAAYILISTITILPHIARAEKNEMVERESIKLRNSILVLREEDKNSPYRSKDLILKVDNKIKKTFKLGDFECGSILGPYQLKEHDIVGINIPSCGCGNGCGDASNITLLTIDQQGNMTPSSLNDKTIKQVSFNCDWLREDATKVYENSIKFKCTGQNGRREKNTYFTFENGRINIINKSIQNKANHENP
ncbi:hypothetical protein [Oryzomicrobium sp.]|uniref:hypothetical protein n=1 Tax=Oryzomicrobium sp. TaxID=1911578 RepID=UPI0025E5A9C5|nr:hypothetical protein [Oryzomicrobium sp.]MCE1242526.1 hypothetical protein [Oryzomicrobium sp.]